MMKNSGYITHNFFLMSNHIITAQKILFILFVLFLFSGCNKTSDIQLSPKAKIGVLDLRNWDFQKQGYLPLNGEWEIYWKELLPPSSIPATAPSDTHFYLKFPSIWNDLNLNNNILGGTGFATFRLIILTSRPLPDMILKPSLIHTAFRLYLNNKLVIKSGVVGKDVSTSVPEIKNVMEHIELHSGRNEIILQVSNFHHQKGGPRRSIILGTQSQIIKISRNRLARDLFISGCLAMIGLYHLCLFVLRRSDKATLFFSLLCLLFAFRSIIGGENYFTLLFPSFPWAYYIKVNYFSIAFAVPLAVGFMNHLFPQEFNKKVFHLTSVIALGYATFIFLVPVYISSYSIAYYRYIIIIVGAYCIFALIKAIKNQREGSKIFLFGLFSLAIGVINDLLFASEIIHTGYYSPIIILVFIFFQAFLLSSKYSKAYRRIEELTKELKSKSESLERNLKKLEQVDQLKDEFLANTSHELRTPLAGIIGLSESILEGAYGNTTEQQSRNLKMIIQSGLRLSRLIDDILDFSKLKQGDLQLNIQSVCLFDTVKLILHICQPLVKNKNVLLINQIQDESVYVKADENRLQQILLNLIGNAIKFTSCGEIVVSASLNKNIVTVFVKDTGIGIPEMQQKQIFSAFNQGEKTKGQYVPGTGLGLALTQKLVQLQSGDIELFSVPDDGSTFSFTLPAANRNEQFSYIRTSGTDLEINADFPFIEFFFFQPKDQQPKGHILVVDDDMVLLEILVNYLVTDGFSVTIAIDGKEALDTIDSNEDIDLVLIDVMMPELSGFEFCVGVRKQYSELELPIILLTALSQSKDIASGFACGANDYLVKPLQKNELLSRLNNQLKLKKTADQLKQEKKRLQQNLPENSIHIENITKETAERIKNIELLVGDIATNIIPKKTTVSVEYKASNNTPKINPLLVDVLSSSLVYWKQTTQKSKIDLAIESTIWTASLDNNGTYRTRTMDRYLKVKTLPQKPRYHDIIQTAHWVLQKCPDSALNIKQELTKKLHFLENEVKNL